MEFLKNVLGDSFADVSERIGRYNREHPENQVKLADLSEGKYVSKAKFCDLEAEAKRLKELLSSQHSEDDPDGPEQKLAELKQKYDKDTEALKTELKQAKFNGALDLALERSGAKNTKAVRALLDLDSLELDENGGLSGLSQQLESLRADNGFLFGRGAASTALAQGAAFPVTDGFVASAREAAGMTKK